MTIGSVVTLEASGQEKQQREERKLQGVAGPTWCRRRWDRVASSPSWMLPFAACRQCSSAAHSDTRSWLLQTVPSKTGGFHNTSNKERRHSRRLHSIRQLSRPPCPTLFVLSSCTAYLQQPAAPSTFKPSISRLAGSVVHLSPAAHLSPHCIRQIQPRQDPTIRNTSLMSSPNFRNPQR
ncbi:hypothetical protein N658DRAFT_139036 [Parathielavia hyrcaniae]|uniref:Uncharacterized protein n=1 Tax=Parathielavia hyrcaniae TaxID=113614 RepID=A0AAN6T015_9PEZI|nr:hypothetical protein N658DRAFT_139036 [Parathielavia hyrcaniae]